MIKTEFDFLLAAKDLGIELLAVGLIFFLIEKIRPAEKKTPFFKEDFREELEIALLNGIIFIPVFTVLISLAFIAFAGFLMPYRVFDETITEWPLLIQVILGMFIMDMSTYWRHRFTHRYMWSYHSVHHSAEHLNWLTSLRMHPVDILITTVFNMVVLYIFGFSGPGIILAAMLSRVYNYFTHANIDFAFDYPLCYVLASPNFHRWHHATDKSAYDKNFCGVFSLIDLMFGTYHHPDNKTLPQGYGLNPAQQKEYPKSFGAQLLYPFQRDYKLLKERLGKTSKRT